MIQGNYIEEHPRRERDRERETEEHFARDLCPLSLSLSLSLCSLCSLSLCSLLVSMTLTQAPALPLL